MFNIPTPLSTQVKEFMSEADLNGDGNLSLDEFIGCVSEAKAREDAEDELGLAVDARRHRLRTEVPTASVATAKAAHGP